MANKMVRQAIAAAVLAAAGLGSIQAAEKIRWEDLQKRFQQGKELRVNVITRDGKKHHATTVAMSATEISLNDRGKIETLERQNVERVEIKERKRYYRHIGENAALSVALPVVSLIETAYGCEAGICVWGLLLTPPMVAYTAASAPVFLAADGVAFLLPPKAYDVVE